MAISPLENIINLILKRASDLVLSLLVIILLLSWFIPLLALLIKITSRGPIFFIQPRSGKNGVAFNCIKLRSMYVNNDAHSKQALENDSRITSAGKFIRKFSLDELPQFFNVIYGDMSIIGPRPHMLFHTEAYSEIIDDYMNRLHVKPGITGLSQVMGYRGEIKNKMMIANRVRLDIFYIKKWSVGLDIKIAIKTIRLILLGD
ncbi:MAG: sugar transferase [Bacteroidia bacterium]|nr:sugar transferase [Bacteroidia bacterium]